MKKLTLTKETLRKLDDRTLDDVVGGNYADNTTIGRKCGLLTVCGGPWCMRLPD